MEDMDETEFRANEDPETEEDRLESDGVADALRVCERWPFGGVGAGAGADAGADAVSSPSVGGGTSGNSNLFLGDMLGPDPAPFAIAKSPLTKSLPCESTLDDEGPVIN